MWLQEEEGGGLLKEGGSHQHSGIPAHSIFFVLSSTPFFLKKKEIFQCSICFQRIRHVFDSTLFILHIWLLAPLIFNGFKLYKDERWE